MNFPRVKFTLPSKSVFQVRSTFPGKYLLKHISSVRVFFMLSSRGVMLMLRHENMTNQISSAGSIPCQIAITNVVPLRFQRCDIR